MYQVSADYPAAAREFQAAIAMDPQHAPAWGALGSIALQTGDFRIAERELRRALELKAAVTRSLVAGAFSEIYGQSEPDEA